MLAQHHRRLAPAQGLTKCPSSLTVAVALTIAARLAVANLGQHETIGIRKQAAQVPDSGVCMPQGLEAAAEVLRGGQGGQR